MLVARRPRLKLVLRTMSQLLDAGFCSSKMMRTVSASALLTINFLSLGPCRPFICPCAGGGDLVPNLFGGQCRFELSKKSTRSGHRPTDVVVLDCWVTATFLNTGGRGG